MARKKRQTKSPGCKTCGKRIYRPKDWSVGAAVRKHYWKYHPEVMRGES